MSNKLSSKGSFSKTIGLGQKSKTLFNISVTAADVRAPGLDDFQRPCLEGLLAKMGQHIAPNVLIMAKMEYNELLEVEKQLKRVSPNKYKETSKGLPVLNMVKDPKWGPNLYVIIEKSRTTPAKNISDEALRELNSLQRSALAHEDHNRSTPIGSPRELKTSLKKSVSIGKTSTRPRHNTDLSVVIKDKPPASAGGQKQKQTGASKLSSSFSKSIHSRPQNVHIPKPAGKKDGGTVVLSKVAYEEMQRKMEAQERQLEELTTRLSTFASKQMTEGNPAITDLSDQNRPTKIGEKFASLYDEEWSEAFEAITRTHSMSEEDTVYLLLRVVRYAYNFCSKLAESQLQELRHVMESQILHPQSSRNLSSSSTSKVKKVSIDYTKKKLLNSVTAKQAKGYRKSTAVTSIPEAKELFREQVLLPRLNLDPKEEHPLFLTYVDLCVEVTWLMCVQDPPMVITWATKGEPINTDYYSFYKKKGLIAKEAVWPVLFLHANGPMVSKGFVLPE